MVIIVVAALRHAAGTNAFCHIILKGTAQYPFALSKPWLMMTTVYIETGE
jgi:hypothetical protein